MSQSNAPSAAKMAAHCAGEPSRRRFIAIQAVRGAGVSGWFCSSKDDFYESLTYAQREHQRTDQDN